MPTEKMSPFSPVAHPVAGKLSRRGLVVKGSASSSLAFLEGDSFGLLERCFAAPLAFSKVMASPVMKGQYGSLGSVTLEKGKLDLSKKQSQSSPEVCFFRPFLLYFIGSRIIIWSSFIRWLVRNCVKLEDGE